MAFEASLSAYLTKYVNTASNGNVYINWSQLDNRSHMRCKRCSAVRIMLPEELVGGGVEQSLQEWPKGHKHYMTQAVEEEKLRKEMIDMAQSIGRSGGNVAYLQAKKAMLEQRIKDKLPPATEPTSKIVPQVKGRKYR